MNDKIGILHLEDSFNDSELIHSIIESGEISFNYYLANNEYDYLNILKTENIDIILSDYSMPGYKGSEALKLARQNYSYIPFIFVSGTIGEDAAINAMLNGATDYVLKNKLDRLVPAIKRAIHERKLEISQTQAKIVLRESEERFKAIFNDAPMGIALIDSITGKILAVNPRFASISGRTIDEMVKIDWMSITHPDDIQLDLNKMVQLVAGEINGFQIEKRYVHPDQSIVWINMTISKILHDEKSSPRHVCMIEDITESRQAKQELIIANKELAYQNREKEKRADELYIANKELIYQNQEKENRASELIIANKELLFQNEEKEKRAAELKIANKELAYQNREKEKRSDELIIANKELAYQNEEKEKRASELIIANKELLYQNEEKEKRAAELRIANKELDYQNREKEKRADELIIANKELAYQNEEKEKRAAELLIANKELLYQNEEKEKRAAELIIANKELAYQNVEKEKRAAELSIAKDKAEESDRLKSAFLANMSHEIRTPMNGILGFAELLIEPELTGELQQEYIGNIQKSGERMMNIISDIMNISKIESGHMEISLSEVNINELLEEAFSFFKPEAEKKGLQIFIKSAMHSDQTIVKTDRDKVHAILTNLIKNAIKFTDKGSIEFGYILRDKACDARDKACLVSTTKYIEFYVKDTGIGIDPEKIEMIFERFRQGNETLNKKYEGAGLGLPISKAFVEMLGGKIWIEKDPELLDTGNNRDVTGTTICFTIPYNS